MKRIFLAGTAGLALPLALGWAQTAIPSLISGHAQALRKAESMTATLTVQPLPGSPYTVKIAYSKPNRFRIERNGDLSVSDGQTVTVYSKDTNSYTVNSLTDEQLASLTSGGDLWAWAPFFLKDPYKGIDAAKVGGKRTVKGVQVTEGIVAWKDSEGTLYVNPQAGYAKGFSIKQGEKQTLVLADQLELSDKPLDAATFAFQAPEGSKRVEEMKPSSSYKSVRAILNKSCMPCHNSSNRKEGVDLSSYDAVMGSDVVKPGDPDGSRLAKVITGPGASMPLNRPHLPASDVQAVRDWIKDGAKAD